MPNHIHGIIEIIKNDIFVGAESISARNKTDNAQSRADIESAPTVGRIVQSFKCHTTIKYIEMVKQGLFVI